MTSSTACLQARLGRRYLITPPVLARQTFPSVGRDRVEHDLILTQEIASSFTSFHALEPLLPGYSIVPMSKDFLVHSLRATL